MLAAQLSAPLSHAETERAAVPNHNEPEPYELAENVVEMLGQELLCS